MDAKYIDSIGKKITKFNKLYIRFQHNNVNHISNICDILLQVKTYYAGCVIVTYNSKHIDCSTNIIKEYKKICYASLDNDKVVLLREPYQTRSSLFDWVTSTDADLVDTYTSQPNISKYTQAINDIIEYPDYLLIENMITDVKSSEYSSRDTPLIDKYICYEIGLDANTKFTIKESISPIKKTVIQLEINFNEESKILLTKLQNTNTHFKVINHILLANCRDGA